MNRIAVLKLAVKRALRLGAGVAIGLTGLAVTGGSFGLFAVIGIPIMAVGLSLISAEVNRDGPSSPSRSAIVVAKELPPAPVRHLPTAAAAAA